MGSNTFVRFEVSTAVTMKNAVFWDVASCISRVNLRFGGFLYPEDGGDTFLRTSVHTRYTLCYIPEDGILQCVWSRIKNYKQFD
jgi:hypothetical protein